MFGLVDTQILEDQWNLLSIQAWIRSQGVLDILLQEEVSAQLVLDMELQHQEMLFKEKYHLEWPNFRDRNSAYFHRVLKLRKLNKPLDYLFINGVFIQDHQQIRDHVVYFYEDSFSHQVGGHLDEGLIGQIIFALVTGKDNYCLCAIPDLEEVRYIVFKFDASSAPDLD